MVRTARKYFTIKDLRTRHELRQDRLTMNIRKYRNYRPNWNWAGMIGSAACIKWCFRDLRNLEAALGLFTGRGVAVQAGGNLGIFAKRLAEEFQIVHSFEPSIELLKAARHNAPEHNIIYHQAALGEVAGSVCLSAERRHGKIDSLGRERPAHEGLTHIAGEGDIPMHTLDSLALKDVDLIYLDIEGFELKALRGAEETIRSNRPVIAVEVNHNIARYGDSDAELREFLLSRGYRQMIVMNSDEIYVAEETLR